jgi:hypothetical protein
MEWGRYSAGGFAKSRLLLKELEFSVPSLKTGDELERIAVLRFDESTGPRIGK